MLALAEGCNLEEVALEHAHVRIWHLNRDDVERLLTCYQALMEAGLSADAVELLAGQGIDVGDLLTEGAREAITRADLCELAAVAALLAHDDWPMDTLQMPNAPKGSRAVSEHGIDAIASVLTDLALDDELTEEEELEMASVKHSLAADLGGLRRTLTASVTTDLTQPYLFRQLRVYSAYLETLPIRINHQRLFLFLRDDAEAFYVRGIAVVDSTRLDELIEEWSNVPPNVHNQCEFVLIGIDELAALHEQTV
jgi:hypothetical protein